MKSTSSPPQEISSRYVDLEPVGSGATGAVYKGRDTLLDREVAVKVLSTRDASADEVDYFEQEFRTIVDLRHPNLVRVFDFGQVPTGELFYSMEFLAGGALSSLDLPVDRETLLSALVQICRALQYIHSKGITHLDVKPENVLITTRASQGQLHLKLTDFGLASMPRGSAGGRVYGGTPAYAAPEVMAQAAVDSRADLFSLGAMAYELATSRLPFSQQDEPGSGARPPRPSSLNSALGRDVDTLLLKLLEIDPANRYRDANAVIEAVNRLFHKKFALETEKTRTSYVLTPALVGRDEEITAIRKELAALAGVPFSGGDTSGGTRERAEAGTRTGERALRDRATMYEAGAVPDPTAGLILIAGPTGIGKTRLLQDAKIFSQLNRAAFCVGHSVSGSLMPGAPVIEGLRSLVGALPRDKRPEPGPALSNMISARDSDKPAEFSDPSSFAESVYQFLRSASAIRPVVFCIEDLQWADPLTLRTLGHLSRGLFLNTLGEFSPGTQCRIIVTLDDSTSVPKELRAVLKEWADAPYVRRLPLGNLSPAAVGQVVSSMFGPRALPEGAAERLHTATAGVPLFLQQLIAQLLRQGAIRRELGQWKLEISLLEDLPVPKGTRQRAKTIMAGLTREQVRVMQVLSVMTSPANATDVSALAQISYPAARTALKEISDRALVAQGRGAYYISDAPLRKNVYSSMGPHKRRQLHLDAADLIETRPVQQRLKIHALAHHYLAAKNRERGLKWGLAAARDSMRAQANREAASYYESLLKLEPEPALKTELLTEYGQTLARMGVHDEAIKAYKEALGTRAKVGVNEKAKILRLIAQAYQEKGQISDSRRSFRRAISLPRASQNEAALARARLAVLEHNAGRPIAADKQIAKALDSVRKRKVRHAVSSHVYRIAGSILTERGKPHDAMPYLQKALRHAVAAHDEAAQSSTYTSLSWLYHTLAMYRRSRRAALAGLHIASRMCDPIAAGVKLLSVSGAHYRNGEYGAAIRYLIEASSLFERADSNRLYALCLCNLGLVQIEMGQYETGFQYLHRALSIQESRAYNLAALRSRSVTVIGLIQTGRVSEVRRLARRCVTQARKSGSPHEQYLAEKRMADVYLLRGQPTKARTLLVNSLRGFVHTGERDEICECLAKFASLEEAAGNRESSASYASRAKHLAQTLNCKPIQLMALSSTTPNTSREVSQIKKLALQVESPELRWRAHAACARFYVRRGDLQAAIDEYGKCLAVFRSVTSDMKDDSLKKSYLSHPERSSVLAEVGALKQKD